MELERIGDVSPLKSVLMTDMVKALSKTEEQGKFFSGGKKVVDFELSLSGVQNDLRILSPGSDKGFIFLSLHRSMAPKRKFVLEECEFNAKTLSIHAQVLLYRF